jgi:hypothetical protein
LFVYGTTDPEAASTMRARPLAGAVLMVVMLVCKAEQAPAGLAGRPADGDVPASTKAATLAEEEKKVAFAQAQELKLTPLASRTEDALLMAGGELHTDRTRLADAMEQQQEWRSAAAATQRLMRKAQKERADAALKVSHDEDTLKRATELVDQARKEDNLEIRHRARSELDQGRGVAMQRPAGVLLADSKKLNEQSNMVLSHSKSTQAKALAALDLKMAQQLADRASSGMVAAKGYFTDAIHQRKEATVAAEAAATDTVNAASVSLTMDGNSPLLHQIENGEEQGPKALQDIIATDAQQVDRAEGQFGAAREALSEDQARARKLSAEIWQVQQKIDGLHKELRTAQGYVLASAKAHVAATQRLEKVSAEALAASTKVDKMRTDESEKLAQELHDARHSQLRASSQYERASEKMEGVNGERTLLQVKVARLKLKLKEAQLQRIFFLFASFYVCREQKNRGFKALLNPKP